MKSWVVCQDDESSIEYNVPYIVDLFYNATMEYKAEIFGNDLMLLMGGDFGYATARMWFENLDKIIHYVNKVRIAVVVVVVVDIIKHG